MDILEHLSVFQGIGYRCNNSIYLIMKRCQQYRGNIKLLVVI